MDGSSGPVATGTASLGMLGIRPIARCVMAETVRVMVMNEDRDVVIVGGGAAGLMCGRVAGQRGRSVLILDHAKRAAEKIRISGGGRCLSLIHI